MTGICTMVFLYIGLGVILAAAAYEFLVAPGRMPREGDALWHAHYAHRGLHTSDQSVPENSLIAFHKAVDAGYGIELDVTITADGEIAVFHDDTLVRACGVDRDIRDCTWAELQACRLFGTDQRIPLLGEALSLVNGRAPLIVELKSTKRYRALCERTAQLLDDYPGLCCIESFDPRIVRWFALNRPGMVRGQLAAGFRSYTSTPWYQSLLMSALLTNVLTRPHFAAYRHQDARRKMGLRLFKLLGGRLAAWTVRSPEDEQRCHRLFGTVIFEYYKPQ